MSTIRYSLAEEAKQKGIALKAPRSGDAALDLPSLEEVTLAPGQQALLRTGVHVAIPEGCVGIVRDRSSMALKGTATTAGVIDSSYRGEIKVVMHNLGNTAIEFKVGDRLAQMLIIEHLIVDEVEELPSVEGLGSTGRGAAGFGSTGK